MPQKQSVNEVPKIPFPIWLKISLGMGLITSLLIIYSLTSLNKTNENESRFRLVIERDAKVITNAELLQKLVVDMETGQRGFIITGEENFLEPYDNALNEFSEVFKKTKKIIADNKFQLNELNEIEKLVKKWQEQAGKPEIQARRDADNGLITMAEVADMLKAQTGKNILDSIRAKFDILISHERNLSEERYVEAVRESDKIKHLSMITITSSIFISILISFIIIRGIKTQLNVIISAANEVTNGNYNQNVYVTANNEFKILATAFNKMMEEINSNLKDLKDHEEELEKYKVNLEALVEQKTIDLKIAIEKAERFAKFPKSNPNPIIQIDYDGNIILANPASEEIFPSMKKKGIKHPLLENILQYKDTLNEKNDNSPINRELTIGDITYYQTIQPINTGKKGFIIYSNNVTPIKEAQLQAERANKLKTEFLANMSHELRTSMHSIITFSRQGIERKEKWSTDEQVENLQFIYDSGERLLALLNDLLDLSKLESGTMEYEIVENNILSTTKTISGQISSLAKEKKIKLDILEPEKQPITHYDESKISQVIFNLLSNAIKFSKNGQTIKVIFKNESEKEPCIKLSVIDEGIGIPPEEIETIFDKFAQSSKTKTGAGGTGLGLAICKEIINAHHGRIWAENNNNGQGATFSFTIPNNYVNKRGRNDG